MNFLKIFFFFMLSFSCPYVSPSRQFLNFLNLSFAFKLLFLKFLRIKFFFAVFSSCFLNLNHSWVYFFLSLFWEYNRFTFSLNCRFLSFFLSFSRFWFSNFLGVFLFFSHLFLLLLKFVLLLSSNRSFLSYGRCILIFLDFCFVFILLFLVAVFLKKVEKCFNVK